MAAKEGFLQSKRAWQFLSLALVLYLAADKGGLLPALASHAGPTQALLPGPATPQPGAPVLEELIQPQPSVKAPAPEPLPPVWPEPREPPQQHGKQDVLPLDHRALSGSESSSSGGTCSSHEGAHPQDALFFLFNALIFGTVILQLTMLPKLHGLQQTVVLYVLGVTYSLVQEGLGLQDDLGGLGRSYSMWMSIDPHLLLFAMLPVLLTGDAMTIDTSIARSVAWQCIYLAGPGVLIGAFLTAGFLYVLLPYNWPFLLCLVSGSILAATDPVAVVGLLKELGANPTLTVQIQGESLLNDGTAIVLYTVAYSMLKGEEYDGGDIIIFLVKTALCAAGLGVVIGWVFVLWIRFSGNRLAHHSGMVQSALTLCCAYWSFIISEGVLHISGVLCTVAASLVLADKMWPAIVDKDSLLHVWHMFEYLGNTLIFFLAGALSGKTMINIPLEDYGYLIIIYIVTTLIRGAIFFCSRPILTHLSEDHVPVTMADCTIMTWGGLRGAVGLVLAMQVSIDRACGLISQLDGDRVLFYVGGIATLTLCINATTCPALVNFLGITSTPEAKQRLLLQIHAQLTSSSKAKQHSPPVQATLDQVLHSAKHHIEELVQEKEMSRCGKMLASLSEKFNKTHHFRCRVDILEGLRDAKLEFSSIVSRKTFELLDMPELEWAMPDKEEVLKEMVRTQDPEGPMVQAVNEAFLNLVQSHYWKQIEAGDFVAGTSDAEMLLNSVSLAFKSASRGVVDFTYLVQSLGLEDKMISNSEKDEEPPRELAAAAAQPDGDQPAVGEEHSRQMMKRSSSIFHRLLQSIHRSRVISAGQDGKFEPQVVFNKENVSVISGCSEPEKLELTPMQQFLEDSLIVNLTIAIIIIANAIFIFVEQSVRDDTNTGQIHWLIIEIFFNVIFTMELLTKMAVFRLAWIRSCWNWFDLILVILGLSGLVIEAIAHGGDSAVTTEARLLRMNRVFRVLRIVRVFRLARFYKILRARLCKKDLSLELAERLQTITVLRAFVRAHTRSQSELLKFVGKEGQIVFCEEARCIMESQTEVYKAVALAANEAQTVNTSVLSWMALLRSNIKATAELSGFVLEANKAGIINAREAECVLHPLEDHLKKFYKNLQESQEGMDTEKSETSFKKEGPGDSHASIFGEAKHTLSIIPSSTGTEASSSFTEEAHVDVPPAVAVAKVEESGDFCLPGCTAEEVGAARRRKSGGQLSNEEPGQRQPLNERRSEELESILGASGRQQPQQEADGEPARPARPATPESPKAGELTARTEGVASEDAPSVS